MVKKKKPAPDVYLMAVETMGLDKNRCVIIEDSHIGVGAAVAAGIPCLVTKSSYTRDEDFTGAEMIVEELGDDGRSGVTLDTLSSLLSANEGNDDNVDELKWDKEGHVELGGASWTGARMGEENINQARTYTASETYAPSSPKGIGVKMEAHIEKGGASWTGARFGDSEPAKRNVLKAYATANPKSIGVKMESHIEKGGASWTGARFGDESINKPHTYTPSETYESKSRGKSSGSVWDSTSHKDVSIAQDDTAWTGARLGDKDVKRCSPTPSQWNE